MVIFKAVPSAYKMVYQLCGVRSSKAALTLLPAIKMAIPSFQFVLFSYFII